MHTEHEVKAEKTRQTYDALRALSEDVRAELVDGEVRIASSVLPRHAYIAGGLADELGGPFDRRPGPGGWWFLLDVDVRFSPHDVVRPDAAGWRRERLESPWDTRPIDVRPDWVCEILSPSNVGYDRVRKADLYAQHGVPHYWMIDPAERVLEALELRDGGWYRLGAWDADATPRVAPFDAIELALPRVFPPR